MTLTEFLLELDGLRARGKVAAAAAHAELTAIIARVQTIATAVTAYERRQTQLVAVPYDEVLTTVRDIEAFVGRYYDDLDFSPELFLTLRETTRVLFDLPALRRAFASQAMLTGALTNAFVPSPDPPVPYRLRQNDTLERIALETLGDITRLQDIIDLNDLEYPYLLTDRDYAVAEFTDEFDPASFRTGLAVNRIGVAEHVKVTGETILLPPGAVVPTTAQLTDRDVELWGRDIAIDGEGLLAVNADGEFLTVEGADNIVQALHQCIVVTRGELVLHPDYGIQRLLAVGIEGTIPNILFSGYEVARTVREDPRVTHVRDIQVNFRDTVNQASMTVGLIGSAQATIPLNVVLPNTIVVAPGGA